MFALARFIQILLLPPGVILLLIAIGLVVGVFCGIVGRIITLTGVLLLYGLSIQPVSDRLMLPLEAAYPPYSVERKMAVKADAIVVLGGGIHDLSWIGLHEPSALSLERTVMGVRLHTAMKLPLLFSGGSGDPMKQDLRECDAMASVAGQLGVSQRDILLEGHSRTTLESAVNIKAMRMGKSFVLVTSAFHMKRAMALFRKQGLYPIPAPCGYQGEKRAYSLFSYLPTARNLYSSSLAISEYMSTRWYRMIGEIDADQKNDERKSIASRPAPGVMPGLSRLTTAVYSGTLPDIMTGEVS